MHTEKSTVIPCNGFVVSKRYVPLGIEQLSPFTISYQNPEGVFLLSLVWEPSKTPGRKTHEIVEIPLRQQASRIFSLTWQSTLSPAIHQNYPSNIPSNYPSNIPYTLGEFAPLKQIWAASPQLHLSLQILEWQFAL